MPIVGELTAVNRRKLRLFLNDLEAQDQLQVLSEIGAQYSSLVDDPGTSTPTISVNNPKLLKEENSQPQHHPSLQVSSDTLVPLSQSHIWSIQQEYYVNSSQAAWNHDVPFQISSNRFVCQYYLSAIQAFLQPLLEASPPTPTVPLSPGSKASGRCRVCLLEVGSGHGRLALLLATELLRRQERGRGGKETETEEEEEKEGSGKMVSEPIAPTTGTSNDASSNDDHRSSSDHEDAFFAQHEWLVLGTDMHTGAFEELLSLPWVR